MTTTPLPDNWDETQLGAVCILVNGRAFRPSDWSADGLPIVRIQNLRDPSAPFNRYDGPVDERHLVEDGDLLFAWSGTPGTSFGAHIWNGGRAVLNQHIFKLNFRPELFHPRFLQLAINSQLPQLIRKAKGGAGLKHLNKPTVEAVPVPVPPREEQDRIVFLLDATVGRLNAIASELINLSEAGARLTNLILAAATSGRLPENDALPLVNRSAGGADELPAHWKRLPIGELGEVMLGRQRSPEHHFGPNMRPYLRVANVLEDRIDTSDVMAMNFSPAEFERFRLQAGDILLNEGQSLDLVGRPAMFRGELKDVCFTNTLVRFRAGSRVLPEYALIVFRHYLRSGEFRRIATITTNLAHLGARRFASLLLPVPPLEEQAVIAQRCRAALTAVTNAKHHIGRLLDEKERLAQTIEAAALSGRLTEQALDVEPKPHIKALERQRRPGTMPTLARTASPRSGAKHRATTEVDRMKQPRPVVEVLQAAGAPLNASEVFTGAGYPDDASVNQVEQFFIELRDALATDQIRRYKKGYEDMFKATAESVL